MSKKHSNNLEEGLRKILEPGTDSEIEELGESDTEDDTSITLLLLHCQELVRIS